MTDSPDSDRFENVNEAVEAEWTAESTPFDRVQAVMRRRYEPASANDVANRALTTPKTARKHLESLVDSGFLATERGETGAKLYRRSPESLVTEHVQEILREVETDELAGRIVDLRQELDEYRDRFGVGSPEELAVRLGNEGADADDGVDAEVGDGDVDPRILRAWQTTRRNLAFANAALAVANAQDIADDVSTVTP